MRSLNIDEVYWMYTKCGGILDAYKVFQGLDDPNVVSGYVKYEHDEED